MYSYPDIQLIDDILQLIAVDVPPHGQSPRKLELRLSAPIAGGTVIIGRKLDGANTHALIVEDYPLDTVADLNLFFEGQVSQLRVIFSGVESSGATVSAVYRDLKWSDSGKWQRVYSIGSIVPVTIPSEGTYNSIFRTGDRPVFVTARTINWNGEQLQVRIYEGPTFTGTTSGSGIYPENQLHTLQSTVELLSGATVEAVGTEVFSADSYINSTGVGAEEPAGFQRDEIERVLKPNTLYLQQLVNPTGDPYVITIKTTWYEPWEGPEVADEVAPKLTSRPVVTNAAQGEALTVTDSAITGDYDTISTYVYIDGMLMSQSLPYTIPDGNAGKLVWVTQRASYLGLESEIERSRSERIES